jgi:hypothetical protein
MKLFLSALALAVVMTAFPAAVVPAQDAKTRCYYLAQQITRVTGAQRDALVAQYNKCLKDNAGKK